MNLFEIYKKKRIVNINVNIIIASLVSIVLSLYPVYLTKMISNSAGAIALISFGIDALIDGGIFIILHGFLNKKQIINGGISSSLKRDIFRIQAERMVLSVFYFVFAVGGHYILIMNGLGRTAAFALSYIFALALSRYIHTLYGLRFGLFEPLKN